MDTSSLMQARIAEVESVADTIRAQHQRWLTSSLVKLYPCLESVLLFGSRINGSATNESDFDIFVVAERYQPGLHDWWLSDGQRIDVHVVNPRFLAKSIATERVERTCFHVRAFSEGVFMCCSDGAKNFQRLARSIYVSPGEFLGWGKVKLNLMSKLRRARLRSGVGGSIYYTELLSALLEAISLRQFGWMCRSDVMVEWLRAVVPDQLGTLLDCYAEALEGKPQEMLKVGEDIADDICPWVHCDGSYSVTPDGAVRLLGLEHRSWSDGLGDGGPHVPAAPTAGVAADLPRPKAAEAGPAIHDATASRCS